MAKYTRENWATAGQRRVANSLPLTGGPNENRGEYRPTDEAVSEHIIELYRYDPDEVRDAEERDKILSFAESLRPETMVLLDMHLQAGGKINFVSEDSKTKSGSDADA